MNKVPLIHVTRRKDIFWVRAWLVRIIAVALALVVCGVITMMATGLNPIKVYAAMIDGAFGTSRRLWMLLQNIAILLCISIAFVVSSSYNPFLYFRF